MPFRRDRPLHERLAEEGGLDLGRLEREPHDVTPRWGGAAIHGHHRPREWDAVTTARAEEPADAELAFVVLHDEVVVESDADVPAWFFDAFDASLEPPYRVVAIRKDGANWALGAQRIEVVQLAEDFDAQGVELAVHRGEERVSVDGDAVLGSNRGLFASLRVLRSLADDRGLRDYVVHAERLDGPLWEVRVAAL